MADDPADRTIVVEYVRSALWGIRHRGHQQRGRVRQHLAHDDPVDELFDAGSTRARPACASPTRDLPDRAEEPGVRELGAFLDDFEGNVIAARARCTASSSADPQSAF
jgi:hypothetical protein